MATADEQIRVSEWVVRELDQHRQEGESYSDVLERLLPEKTAADSDDGVATHLDGEAESIREQRKQATQKRVRGMCQLEDVAKPSMRTF